MDAAESARARSRCSGGGSACRVSVEATHHSLHSVKIVSHAQTGPSLSVASALREAVVHWRRHAGSRAQRILARHAV